MIDVNAMQVRTPTINPAVWFHDHGVRVFPLKHRSKESACFWTKYCGTREQTERFGNDGVTLGPPLAVVDIDQHDSIAWCERHLPDTPFIVRTGRGLHLYYRITSPATKFIRRDGLTLEFKNSGQYVVGPGSIHLRITARLPDRPSGCLAACSGDGLHRSPDRRFVLQDQRRCANTPPSSMSTPVSTTQTQVPVGHPYFAMEFMKRR